MSEAPSAPKSHLPEAYGTQQLHLAARDPRWLYAHWDFTRDQQREFNQQSPSGHLSLRVFKDSPGGQFVQQAELTPYSQHWFFPVGCGETNYIADLGYETKRGGWVSLALSNVAVTPPDSLAPDKSAARPVVFATIPMHATFAQIRQALATTATGNAPLVEAIHRYADAAPTLSAGGISVTAPEAPWSLEKTLRLARVMGIESILRRMRGDLSSLAAAQIVPAEAADWPYLESNWDYDQFDLPGLAVSSWSGDLVSVEA